MVDPRTKLRFRDEPTFVHHVARGADAVRTDARAARRGCCCRCVHAENAFVVWKKWDCDHQVNERSERFG